MVGIQHYYIGPAGHTTWQTYTAYAICAGLAVIDGVYSKLLAEVHCFRDRYSGAP